MLSFCDLIGLIGLYAPTCLYSLPTTSSTKSGASLCVYPGTADTLQPDEGGH